MNKSKDNRRIELSAEELAFYEEEVRRVDAMVGTALAFDAANPSLLPTLPVTLAQHRNGRLAAAVIADQTGDPYLQDPRPVDPLVEELRARLGGGTGDYLDEQ